MYWVILILLAAAAPLLFLALLFVLITRSPAQGACISPATALADDPALQTILDTLPHPVAIFSAALQIRLANAPAQELFGLLPGEAAIGSPHRWLLPLLEEARSSRRRVDPAGYGAGIQLFSANRELLFLPHAAPLIHPDTSLGGVALILVDVTGLRQVDEAKSGLLSTLSHELKTPLTSLQMAIHLLADDPTGRLPPRHLELLHTARHDADRLNGLIDDLLDVGRLRSGKAPLQLELVPPATLLDAAAQSLLREFKEKRLTLQTQVPENTPLVRADRTRAASVLATLLTAARRAARPDASIHVLIDADGQRLSVKVRVHNEALDPLFANPASLSGRDGVSLVVAREIAAAHGGAISFTSEPSGPQWQFTLPLVH